ncbi:hypothetical protein [Streptomyces sp. NPDC056227]|uniref:hypothetical protein n=1 Tax=Streptomyces sp. NPDC056227 TaxID=3345753 RepID=UPI0035D818AA
MRFTAAGTKRLSMAALICTKSGHRPRLIYRIHFDRGPAKGRCKGFTETGTHACPTPHISSSAARSSWSGTT